ncbi:MAG: SH3 domain-containing protein, partial [Clostridia bacterium]|nr:SH3 domain-containing protein [Clostridia bacterium]
TSDGTYLYAKSLSGFISVYDENIDIALDIDDVFYEDLTGRPVVAGSEGNLYIFATDSGKPYMTVCNATSGNISEHLDMSCYVTKAFIGDVIYAQVSTASGGDSEYNIFGIDKTSGEILFVSEIVPNDFYAVGNKLYTIEGKKIVIYNLKSDLSGFEPDTTISMAGNDAHHLDQPYDIVSLGETLVVADGSNSRLGYIDSTRTLRGLNLDASPLKLTVGDDSVYALCANNTIIKVSDMQVVQTWNLNELNVSGSVVDILYLDKLYILTNSGLYTVLGNTPLKLASVDGGKRIACANDGTHLYVLKNNGVVMMNKSGNTVMTLTAELDGATDIAIDYAGQVFVLYQDKVQQYANRITSFEMVDETVLKTESNSIRVSANSAYLDGENLYFTADECLIGKLEVNSTTKDSYTFEEYAPSANEIYYFAKLKEGVVSYTIPCDGRVDGITSAPKDTLIMLKNASGLGDGFRYALLDGNIFIVVENDFDNVQVAEVVGTYSAKCETTLYALPDIDEGKLTIAERTRFSAVSDCADYDGGVWMRVKYADKTYFVKSENCEKISDDPIPPNPLPDEPTEKTLYGKAKATRGGGLVSVYSAASVESPALKQIVDGTDIEILEQLDEFYLVRTKDDVVGYMHKDDVKIGGLTNVQIIAIVLAIFVALTGICIFVVIEITKKKHDTENNKQKQ